MKHRWIVILAAGVLVAPGPLAAQQQRGGQTQGPQLAEIMQAVRIGLAVMDQSNVHYLLSRGSELNLTADQRTRMLALATRWSQATRASRDTLRSAMRRDPQTMRNAQVPDMQGRLQQLMPHAMLLFQEDQKALMETIELLEPAQRDKAKALIEERIEEIKAMRGGR
jgi:hypothetical protein